MSIAFLILGIHTMLFSMCFAMAAFYTAASDDQEPLNAETERNLRIGLLMGMGSIALLAALSKSRAWRLRPECRKFSHLSLAFALATALLICVAMVLG